MRNFIKPVIVCGAVRYPDCLRVMRRRVEGQGKSPEQVIKECLDGRKDHGFPWVITESPILFQKEGASQVTVFSVDMHRGHLVINAQKRVGSASGLRLLKGGRRGSQKRSA